MSKYIPGNQKHLTLEDRIYIQNELDKGTFLNAKSFCTRRFHCKKTNACASSFSVVSSAPPVRPVTRPARIFKKNAAPGLTELLTSAMDAAKKLFVYHCAQIYL